MAKELYVGDQIFVSQYGNSTISRQEYEDLMMPMISEESRELQAQIGQLNAM